MGDDKPHSINSEINCGVIQIDFFFRLCNLMVIRVQTESSNFFQYCKNSAPTSKCNGENVRRPPRGFRIVPGLFIVLAFGQHKYFSHVI